MSTKNLFRNIFSLALTMTGLFWFGSAQAATIYGGSATQVIYEKQTFVLDWFLDTEGSSINTLDLKIKYNSDVLQVKEANEGSSVLSIWLKRPTFDNNNGTMELTGGAPNGFVGANVPIFRTVFEAVKTGNAQITIEPGSVALRNDGQGTHEVIKFTPIQFAVIDDELSPNIVSSPTHPDQSAWYKDKRAVVTFDVKAGTDYSYSFSSNLEIFPDDVKEERLGEVAYENLPDGIYYFKLNSKVGLDVWQEAAVYRIQIDSTPPEQFFPEIGSDPQVNNGKSFLSFSALDKTSGIWHYDVAIGEFRTAKNASSPLVLSGLIFGNKISVTAYDYAGNSRTETIEYNGIPLWIPAIVFLALIIAAVFILRRLYGKKKAPEPEQVQTKV